MPQLADHVHAVPPSGIRRIHEIALAMRAAGVTDLIGLAVGEPDVPVAPHILAAGSATWLADDVAYTPNGGIPELRRAIVDTLAVANGVAVDVEQVWVTVGATQALFLALGLVAGPGDEVLVPDPGYTTFTMGARMLSAVPVPYRLRPEDDFAPRIEELERAITPRTRAIIVNSPSNPLGAVYDRSVLEALLDLARRHDLWLISDEVYEAFAYDSAHVSLVALEQQDGGVHERVLAVHSLSKTYALTGGRVGYLVVPAGFAPILRTYQEAMISCVDTPAQRAAVAAITGPQDAVQEARVHYRRNLAAASELLGARGIAHLAPTGAFYLWIDVSHATGGDVAAWAERFLLEQRVSVAPGSAFGTSGEGWIRVCAAASREDLIEGLRRLPAP